MTVEEVQTFVRWQSIESTGITSSHRISLEQALVPPQKITVIARNVIEGRINDEEISVWLVGQENFTDGYRIVMREDGSSFGLASSGFQSDKHFILTGWYGSLQSAFLNM